MQWFLKIMGSEKDRRKDGEREAMGWKMKMNNEEQNGTQSSQNQRQDSHVRYLMSSYTTYFGVWSGIFLAGVEDAFVTILAPSQFMKVLI